MMFRRKYPIPRLIAVDVDDTLIREGKIDKKLIDWCRQRKAEGFQLLLWSMKGESYARETAERFGVADVFDRVIGKPGYIVDDEDWNWTRFTIRVRYWLDSLSEYWTEDSVAYFVEESEKVTGEEDSKV